MARARKIRGTCHICGSYGWLSFEHVPPRAAFNDRPVLLQKFEDALSRGPDDAASGTIQQKGSGAYTLCPSCNNRTGSWYGHHFVEWCYQGMSILSRAGGKPSLIYLNYVFPLSIIKQIYAMFLSVNSARFRERHPELVRLVLNREAKYLPPGYRVFAYYTAIPRPRMASVSGLLNLNTGVTRVMSEIAYPPFGYLLTFEHDAPDERLFEITHFARYGYGEFAVLELRLPVLPTHTAIPGDYRSREQIYRDAGRSPPDRAGG